jgi:hypothetical protein
MEAARIAKIEDGAPSAVESAGSTSIVSEQDDIKVCLHRYCGCISQNGYTCTNPGPCDPVNENGRRFAVSYTNEAGQTFMHRELVPVRSGNKAVCGGRCMCQPENHAGGKGACGKVIDSDVANEALALVARLRAHPGVQ